MWNKFRNCEGGFKNGLLVSIVLGCTITTTEAGCLVWPVLVKIVYSNPVVVVEVLFSGSGKLMACCMLRRVSADVAFVNICSKRLLT